MQHVEYKGFKIQLNPYTSKCSLQLADKQYTQKTLKQLQAIIDVFLSAEGTAGFSASSQ